MTRIDPRANGKARADSPRRTSAFLGTSAMGFFTDVAAQVFFAPTKHQKNPSVE